MALVDSSTGTPDGSSVKLDLESTYPLPSLALYISLIRRLKMDRVVSFLLWPFQFLANSGKWLARQMRPIRDEEKADDENEKTDDSCCFLGIFGAGVSVGSLYYIPTQYNAV
ncbi:uncharacterized protein LOC143923656 isoform X2 [Lithobates pipiens]